MKHLLSAILAVALLLSTALANAASEPKGGPPPEPFVLTSGLVYSGQGGKSLRLDLFKEHGAVKPPLVIWLPRRGVGQAPGAGLDGRFPMPIAAWLGSHYAVASLDYATPASKAQNLGEALAYLTARAEELGIDATNVAMAEATDKGYTLRVLRQTHGSGGILPRLELTVGNDVDYRLLQSPANTKAALDFLAAQLGGGVYDAAFNPLTMADPPTAWVDPITNAPEGTQYRLYPAPSRGAGAFGSYLIALPDGYQASGRRRYPVLYYLHGGGGSQREGGWLVARLHQAMRSGTMPPAIIVLVQALPIGWYCNADTSAPGVLSGQVEDVLVHDLVPHIDATWRTIAKPQARGLEGWSMGGFGALRLAFKHPELFGHASSLAGAVIDWEDEHNTQYLINTFGPNDAAHVADSKAWFDAAHPRKAAADNIAMLKERTHVRLLVGDQDWLYDNHGKPITKLFSQQLTTLGIAHEYGVVQGVGHMLPQAFGDGTAAYPLDFWRAAFESFK